MKKLIFAFIFILLSLSVGAQSDIPYLKKAGTATQLIVEGKPFLMLGGELGNSSTADAAYMQHIWLQLKAMNLNTALVPVYWELMEPEEGQFDFSLVDEMIAGARENNLKLVLLWFGSWKNSMSCYAPGWVKKDFRRFPRTRDRNGVPSEILSPFFSANLQADSNAFEALMKHLKSVDEADRTVIMVQVENEIGQLPEARDYSPAATKLFLSAVPESLMNYLQKNQRDVLPHITDLWANSNFSKKGTWQEVFGKNLATDELFAAWYFAQYTDRIARAGKEIYNLPMYVNCALNRPGVEPGKYPGGGPLPHLINIWQAGAPHIDMLSPDIYHGDFRHWCRLYDTLKNPLFIPEIKMEPENAAQVFYVIGRHKALGFCPFSIESASENEKIPLSNSYRVLGDLTDLIMEHRSGTDGVYLDKENQSDTIPIGDYQLIISHVSTLPWSDGAKAEKWTPAGCIIIQTAPDEFWIGGTAIACTFRNLKNKKVVAGILSADICTKSDKNWKFRRLNGDQTHQGRHMRISSDNWEIQRVKLYDFN